MSTPEGFADARFITTAEAGEVAGAVVAVDVLRAFTTAAYALAGGARHIYLVATVAEALADEGGRSGGHRDGRGARPPPAGLRPVELAGGGRGGRCRPARSSRRPADLGRDPGRGGGCCGDPAVVRQPRRGVRDGRRGEGLRSGTAGLRADRPEPGRRPRVGFGRPIDRRAHRARPARAAVGRGARPPARSRRRRRRRTRSRSGRPARRPTTSSWRSGSTRSRSRWRPSGSGARSGSNGANRGSSIAAMPHVRANGLDIGYDVIGDGPPLVLLHGATSVGRETFAAQIPTLAARFRLYLPGCARPRRDALGRGRWLRGRLAGRRPRGLRRRARSRSLPPRRLLDGRR